MKTSPAKKTANRAARGLLYLLLGIVVFVSMIYSPLIQDSLFPSFLKMISSPDGMEISVERVRLRFPLDLDVKGLNIMQKGDTMLIAREASLSVHLLPLLAGEVESNDIRLRDIYFKSGNADSATYIRARVDAASIGHPAVKLSEQDVKLGRIAVSGGVIRIISRPDTTPPTPPSQVGWRIRADEIALNDIDYSMTVVGSIDTLSARLSDLRIADGDIDLGSHIVDLGEIGIDGLDAKMLVPKVPTAAPVQQIQQQYADTLPWTISIDRFRLENSAATYAVDGAAPKPGLDFDNIRTSNISIEIDSLYNRASTIVVPLRKLHICEASGLRLSGSGLLSMTDSLASASNFKLNTVASTISLDAKVGLIDSVPSRQPLDMKLKANIEPGELRGLFPEMASTIDMLPAMRTIDIDTRIIGTMADITIDRLRASMRNTWDINVKGDIRGLNDFSTANADISIRGDIRDTRMVNSALNGKNVADADRINLPPIIIDGKATMRRGNIAGNLKATTAQGALALLAHWNGRVEAYDVDLTSDNFPLGSILPGSGIGDISIHASAKGRGLDIYSPKTDLTAAVDATSIGYKGRNIEGISLSARLGNGVANIGLHSTDPLASLDINAAGNLDGNSYLWTLDGDIGRLDIYALGLTDSVANASGRFNASVDLSPADKSYRGHLSLNRFDVEMGPDRFYGSNFDLTFATNDSATSATLRNNDLRLDFTTPNSIDSLTTHINAALDSLSTNISHREADVRPVQHALPRFSLNISAGTNNVVYNYLADNGTTFRHFNLNLSNDSTISLKASADSIVSGETRLDRVNFSAIERGDKIVYKATVDNKPGTLDEFAHLSANGYIGDSRISTLIKQQNIDGRTGFRFGAVASINDSALTVRFVPYQPTIGYKEWQVNEDNYIALNTASHRIRANLDMSCGDSRLHLFTYNEADEGEHSDCDDIGVEIENINLSDWIPSGPYTPKIKGILSANADIELERDRINGSGTIGLKDFIYNKKRVGSLEFKFDLNTLLTGELYADASLEIDDRPVLTLSGALNDTTSVEPIDIDVNLTRLPLSMTNPFVAPSATLGGYLSGNMRMTRSLTAPLLNGYLAFDSATVKVAMIGSTLNLTDSRVAVDSNLIRFDNFAIYGSNDNPLYINGDIDMRSLSNPTVDLSLNADNMQIVNNDKRKGSDVYGKAFISLDATAKGNSKFLQANADVTVLGGTNVTYIIPDATSSFTTQTHEGVVRFVNFADTTAVVAVDSVAQQPGALMLNASLTIDTGSTISVDLSADGSNKAQLQPNGSIDYTLSPMGDSRCIGRINIPQGFVRYTPPLMSEKLFEFQEGSYISFNGAIDNPQLNITAVDRIKANVTQEGQNSRLINFDVTLKARGSLNDIQASFDLSTDDDITVENELQSMSAEQRANQAMNLLLYNMYTGPGTKGNASLTGNPLYSFLESNLNTWMANNVKAVDISVGIDQYTRDVDGVSSNTTSYSYQVSKNLFNNRFKIAVGGNYTTDANPDENLSQNLINDISFEYMLNRKGTMLVKLFRHTGYESILEGEVTQTGVGFVYKRKVRTLGRIFRFLHPSRGSRRDTVAADTIVAPVIPLKADSLPNIQKIEESEK